MCQTSFWVYENPFLVSIFVGLEPICCYWLVGLSGTHSWKWTHLQEQNPFMGPKPNPECGTHCSVESIHVDVNKVIGNMAAYNLEDYQ